MKLQSAASVPLSSSDAVCPPASPTFLQFSVFHALFLADEMLELLLLLLEPLDDDEEEELELLLESRFLARAIGRLATAAANLDTLPSCLVLFDRVIGSVLLAAVKSTFALVGWGVAKDPDFSLTSETSSPWGVDGDDEAL